VAPKKGRLLVFDGALLHAGNTPRTNAPRININFDAFVYEGAQPLGNSPEMQQAGS
jgi:ectoine hydroxylase-related dioxygenase (phytanoyl-CoA dioxygenase family)